MQFMRTCDGWVSHGEPIRKPEEDFRASFVTFTEIVLVNNAKLIVSQILRVYEHSVCLLDFYDAWVRGFVCVLFNNNKSSF